MAVKADAPGTMPRLQGSGIFSAQVGGKGWDGCVLRDLGLDGALHLFACHMLPCCP